MRGVPRYLFSLALRLFGKGDAALPLHPSYDYAGGGLLIFQYL